MKKSSILIILILSGVITSAVAQRVKPTYRQFLFNPYLYNPAFVGINDQVELNLVYRKQWVSIDGAPVTTGINLQVPTSDRVMLGLNVVTDKQVLLRNTSMMGTFGYVVPIDHKQTLRFALSGGLGMNDLDLTEEELSTNDPAILNAANNNYYIDGNFGVVYTNGGFRLGFALTELFKSDPFNYEGFNEFSISNLKNRIYSMSYRFNLDRFERVSMEPYVVYKRSSDEYQNAWEAATVIYFKDVLWTGASYHQHGGLGLLLGFNVADKFRFSYNYEFPPFKSDFPAMSTHELQLNMRFGKKEPRR